MTEPKTGPELYAAGLAWLETASQSFSESKDVVGYERAYSASHLAQTCFAGAQAAAWGSVAADEVGDEKLAKAWRATVGDTEPPQHPALTDFSAPGAETSTHP
ncbi:MAG TPA: hypothetical protein VD864_06945 [Nocardioides sp.]|nr:hypothetical protein [Nocardioides sp.]